MPDSLLDSFPCAAAVVDAHGRTITSNALWPAQPSVPPAAEPLRALRRKVLVIDDHPAMGTSLKLLLRAEHEVDAVTSAEAAWPLLETIRYDVILCDLMMPGVTGVDLYRRVFELHPSIAERFVFMTGGTTTASVHQFVVETQRKVLEKPFAPEALRAVLAG